MRRFPLTALMLAGALVLTACSVGGGGGGSSSGPQGIHKIKHIIVIMQENRSFDSYFGTFPGADGIPMANGTPSVCVPDPSTNQCVKPYVDHADVNGGGPHSQVNATADIDGGKMDGFIGQAVAGRKGCTDPTNPACTNSATPDVMGYHTASDIPNYWSYASDFALQDHMFEPNASWSLPAHLFMVSEWSAHCTQHNNPGSCVNALQAPGTPPNGNPVPAAGAQPTPAATAAATPTRPARKATKPGRKAKGKAPIYAWTDLTYLLHKERVSWGYYVVAGTEPDCENDSQVSCAPVKQNAQTPGIWNPLPYFDTVRTDGQLGNIQSVDHFYQAAKKGTLPAVSWIDPSGEVSEHPRHR